MSYRTGMGIALNVIKYRYVNMSTCDALPSGMHLTRPPYLLGMAGQSSPGPGQPPSQQTRMPWAAAPAQGSTLTLVRFITGAKAEAWCLLIHADASLSHGGQGESLVPRSLVIEFW